MKSIKIFPFIFFLFILSCQSQKPASKLLFSNNKLTNIIDSISNRLVVENVNGKKQWKKHFQYIDSLDVSAITYLSDGLKVNGFMAQPKQAGRYPCIIFNRGGSGEFGALKLTQAVAMIGYIAKEGYVVIASNYRGNGGSEGKEEFGGEDVNDVLQLINVLEEVPNADTEKIGMFGGSRGGMMTYIALIKTDKIKVAAVLAAPADKYATLIDRPSMENVMKEYVEGYEENKEAELDKRSAIKWADKFPKDVPLLIMHGNSDWRVKSEQSLRLALELDKYRIPYRLMIFEGADHGISEYRNEYYDQLFLWFKRYLKDDAPLPDMTFHGR